MKNIRKLREKNNLSQAKVADYLGISRQMYLKYESEEVDPPVKVLTLLCKLYSVSYDELICDEAMYRLPDWSKCGGFVTEAAPAYGVDVKSVPAEAILQKKFENLSEEQKKLVFNIIDSIASMNGKDFSHDRKYREAGGLSGEFWMSDDFDETPECFKDYM